jgi:hypothetical protein
VFLKARQTGWESEMHASADGSSWNSFALAPWANFASWLTYLGITKSTVLA